MISKLTFKKAFGLDFLPADMSIWLLELGKTEYGLILDEQEIKISTGTYGVNKQEKSVLSLFLHSGASDLRFISEVPTIDISLLDIQIEVSDFVCQNWYEDSIGNKFVEQFTPTAFRAINRFIDSYRDVKYLTGRRTEDWLKQGTLIIPQMTEREFKTYLFYVLEAPPKTFVGSIIGIGAIRAIKVPDIELQERLKETINKELPLERKLMVRVWEYFFLEDFRSALISSATVIEMVLIKMLRKSLTSRSVATGSQVDRFLEQISNRLLFTVILGLLEIGNGDLRDRVAAVFEIRNKLLHGKKKNVRRDEVKAALDTTEEVLDAMGICNTR
jgi:hypothetical protein